MKLCDVAHVFDVTSRDFSCILPAVLLQKGKHKRAKCFSKEFRSLMRLDPQGNENFGMCIGNQSWEVCTPTNSCASLSSGNQVLGFSVGERILDVAEDFEGWSESSNKQVWRMPDCERMRLSSIEGTASVPLNLGQDQQCVETVGCGTGGSKVVSEVQELKTGPGHRVPPLILRRVQPCNGFDSHVDLADNFTVSEEDKNVNCLVENGLIDGLGGDVDTSNSFSCQRTTAYLVRPRLSCARTYRSWPFPRRGPPCEIKALIRTGPQWIVTTKASEGTKNVINKMQIGFDTSSENTVGNDKKESLIGLEPHNVHAVVQNSQEQVQSTTQREMVLASATLEETSKDNSEHQKNPGKAWISVSSEEKVFKHCPNMFQQGPANLGSVHENDSQAVDIHSPLGMNSDELIVIPAGLIDSVETKSVDIGDSSMSRAQISMAYKCREDNEKSTESTTFHLPDPLPDLQHSAFQNLQCIVHSSVEPKPPSSVIVHPKGEQKSNSDIENGSCCSLNVLLTKTADQNVSSTTCTGGSVWDIPLKSMTNRDFFFSSEEEISSLSPAERPEKDDAECSLLQYEMCETDPSPLSAPVSSVVTGGDLDVVQAYKDDAIVLDVIQDDPDLFGAIAMDSAGNSAPKANPAALQWEKNMYMQTDQTTLLRKPNRIVWELESGRYVGVYKQAHFLYFMNLLF